ncbi:MAG: nucleotide-binding universal stress UspA family protein [Cyclobacteriaceae bacterium]|jgi:nucleotide-binding universal stress UspA family protein
MKRILIPTDFSQCAGFATSAAIEIAKRSNSEVHFLHFMPVPVNWLELESGQDKIFPEITEEVNQVKAQLDELVLNARSEGLVSDSFLGFNQSSSNITHHIKEQNFDLVIMGSHGSSGVRELFIGSNAQRIARQSPVPVLILKHTLASLDELQLTFVSDFEMESVTPFEQLIEFAEPLGLKVDLLYLNSPAYFADSWEIHRRMESFIFMAGPQLGKVEILDAYVFEDGLTQYCEDNNNPIIALATHGRRGISKLFYGGFAEKMVNHLSTPVLSFKIPAGVHAAYFEPVII